MPPAPATLAAAAVTSAPPAIPPGSAQTDPGAIRLQLIPHSDVQGRPALGDVVERTFKEGSIVRIGRQVIKDGQPTVLKGQKVPQENDIWFASKVVSRNHAEMWVKDGQIYVKDIGSSSGTFLNKMRLSPSGKESRPYPLKEADLIQFGVDYKGKPDDIYKSIMVRIGFYDQSWVGAQRRKANPARFRTALKMLLAAANPFGSANGTEENEDDTTGTDCCICIGAIGPFQALFVAPCSHCYHYKCVHSILAQSAMFQCPMCRQVANLAASVSTDSLFDEADIPELDAAIEAVGRQLGQLRTDEDGTAVPGSTPTAAAASSVSNPLTRLLMDRDRGSASGDVTPRNHERMAGVPASASLVSPDSDATSSPRSPVDGPNFFSNNPPLRAAAAARPTSTGENALASGASTPERGNTTPTSRRHKRRSSSLTSKLNALLRRAGGNDKNSPSSPAPATGTSPRDSDELVAGPAYTGASSSEAVVAPEQVGDTEDESYSAPTSPVTTDARGKMDPGRNIGGAREAGQAAEADNRSSRED
ncbi:hypothetical protein HDU87_001160 [Geranomyces variabilis]|uniref:Uncharacterized protein n=1 Tax=Geranomyces variabilis TaxID=109894 RepID=A0AAD5XLG1_9FUNG|nr:hypothetical protein HDU87_001160 [Geranomyces variabilis]